MLLWLRYLKEQDTKPDAGCQLSIKQFATGVDFSLSNKKRRCYLPPPTFFSLFSSNTVLPFSNQFTHKFVTGQ